MHHIISYCIYFFIFLLWRLRNRIISARRSLRLIHTPLIFAGKIAFSTSSQIAPRLFRIIELLQGCMLIGRLFLLLVTRSICSGSNWNTFFSTYGLPSSQYGLGLPSMGTQPGGWGMTGGSEISRSYTRGIRRLATVPGDFVDEGLFWLEVQVSLGSASGIGRERSWSESSCKSFAGFWDTWEPVWLQKRMG